jgi:hypothetical protein
MTLVQGRPDLRFKIYYLDHNNTEQVDLVEVTGYSEFFEDYDPIFVSQTIQDLSMRRIIKGYRYRATISFETIKGLPVWRMAKLFDIRSHTRIEFFPNYGDLPDFWLPVTLDDETVRLAYLFFLEHKDFELKLISTRKLEAIEMGDLGAPIWGNIFVTWDDYGPPHLPLPFA